MKLLVATKRGQGDQEGDVFEAIDGELVVLPIGCQMGVAGLVSNGVTTTFMAVERPGITLATYRAMLGEAIYQSEDSGEDEIDSVVDTHVEFARQATEGAVLRSGPPAGPLCECCRLEQRYGR